MDTEGNEEEIRATSRSGNNDEVPVGGKST
jgi:hypothetical protein